MTNNCIFCKIIHDEIPAGIVYRDENVTAFRDLNPVAPTHILIVPNKHIASVNELSAGDETLMGHLFSTAQKIALQEKINANGYRLIVNTGPHGGQTVFHVHMHLIGGQAMKHPMG